jgi:hypothetical protein
MTDSEKSRRMALRRDTGNRAPAAPKVAKSGASYLVAHACFDCCKSFKVAPRDESVVCANCGGELHQMGRSFKAPPVKDTEQWAKVRALYSAGFRFSSYRSHSCAPLPEKLSQVAAFVAEHPDHPMRVAAPNSSFEADGFAAAQLQR